ncbi:MAG: TraR/DksA family transcriptional regulator [Rhodospirillaceae bacterium]|nr:MAG: TraR/DksA family transcriptional regulator [Rhodospirillaceae bacterium]
MDDIDEAQELQRRETESIIRDATAPLKKTGCKDCDDCGSEIEVERRMAMPSARRCIECQRRREQKVP